MKTVEEILDQTFTLGEFDDNGNCKEPFYDKEDVITAMQEYADQFKPKWVRVDDGLPTQEGDYLVFDPDFEAQMVASFSNGKFELDVSYWEPKDITHWMPLPTPPEQ